MVVQVPVIRLERRAQRVDGSSLHDVENIAKGGHHATELQELLLELEDLCLASHLVCGGRRLFGEDRVLDLFGQVLQAVQGVEVPVHDLVEEEIEEVGASLPARLRVPLRGLDHYV